MLYKFSSLLVESYESIFGYAIENSGISSSSSAGAKDTEEVSGNFTENLVEVRLLS